MSFSWRAGYPYVTPCDLPYCAQQYCRLVSLGPLKIQTKCILSRWASMRDTILEAALCAFGAGFRDKSGVLLLLDRAENEAKSGHAPAFTVRI